MGTPTRFQFEPFGQKVGDAFTRAASAISKGKLGSMLTMQMNPRCADTSMVKSNGKIILFNLLENGLCIREQVDKDENCFHVEKNNRREIVE